MKRERRFLAHEFRVDDSGAAPKISGYASKFGVLSEDLGGFRERIDPGAFDACLASTPDIVGLFNHNPEKVLGRTTSGTMEVKTDAVGLFYVIDPPDTQLARDLMVSMKRGDINKSSFGFFCLEDTWDLAEDGSLIRTVLKASVFDCSPVTFPAYPDATSQVRSLFPDGKPEVPEPEAPAAPVIEAPVETEVRSEDAPAADNAEERNSEDEDEEGDDCEGCEDDDCEFCSARRESERAAADAAKATEDAAVHENLTLKLKLASIS
jgi:HK97 family phage prohead protease